MLKVELRKAFHNKFFYSAMGIAMCIALIGAYQSITFHLLQMSYVRKFAPQEVVYPGASLYNRWLGADGGFGMHLFYFLIFLLCTIPYSWSLVIEKKSGYINQMITRTKRTQYYTSKYFAAFVSGGSIALIPMLTNLTVCALFIPAYPMDQLSDLYIGVPQKYMWSSVLYSKPLLYVLMYILLAFVFCGLWATVGISLGFVVKNRLSVLILPFLFTIFVQVFSNYSSWHNGRAIIPVYLIAPRAYGFGNSTGLVVGVWLTMIIIFNGIIFLLKGREKDVI